MFEHSQLLAGKYWAVTQAVTDVRKAADHLRAQGIRMLYDEPKRGTENSRINFAHPKDCGGVLIELVEPAAAQ